MILSVSRRTDIPNYYSEWFYNRIKEGFLYVRNPMNAHQVSEIKITPDVVDCIVFWTKNPLPMMKRLNETKDYNYYFQFTLTGYGNDVEVNLSNKKTEMIPVFQELSEKIGKQKVIWRYDPIFFSDRYTKEYHLKAIKSIAEALSGYTEKCVISFVDIYPKLIISSIFIPHFKSLNALMACSSVYFSTMGFVDAFALFLVLLHPTIASTAIINNRIFFIYV